MVRGRKHLSSWDSPIILSIINQKMPDCMCGSLINIPRLRAQLEKIVLGEGAAAKHAGPTFPANSLCLRSTIEGFHNVPEELARQKWGEGQTTSPTSGLERRGSQKSSLRSTHRCGRCGNTNWCGKEAPICPDGSGLFYLPHDDCSGRQPTNLVVTFGCRSI